MFSIRILPLVAIGCATVPSIPLDDSTEPGDTPTDPTDPTDVTDNAVDPSDFESMDDNQIRALIGERLMELQSLEIVHVGDVVLDLPAEAICAYGWTPCIGFEDDVADALREAAPRVEALAQIGRFAVDENLEAQNETCTDAAIDANLDDLADLEVVQIGDLIAAEPERNCPYSQPCDEDIEAAEQITCERAEALDLIVELAQSL